LICLDEIQRKQDLFPVLRSVVDDQNFKSKILILGSASPKLLKQSSETLAGRISYIELYPFTVNELEKIEDYDILEHWFRGGYPKSYLAKEDYQSNRWRESFIKTFIERDIPQFGVNVSSQSIIKILTLCAYNSGQVFNASNLGQSLGVSYHTINSYVDLLEHSFILRRLEPHYVNIKKRLVKTHKLYVRDTGILHSLLSIPSLSALLSHPICGMSWESFVLENIIAAMPDYNISFYRTSNGSEIDFILEKGMKKIGVEVKFSTTPTLTRGFWQAIDDLKLEKTYVIIPKNTEYILKENVEVIGLQNFIQKLS